MSLQLDFENDFAQIFIVGYVHDMPELLQLAMTYELLRERGQLPDDGAVALREVTELAAKYAPNCEPPVHVVRVRPSGIEEVRNGPKEEQERQAADEGKV